jgi:hypothetical protein
MGSSIVFLMLSIAKRGINARVKMHRNEVDPTGYEEELLCIVERSTKDVLNCFGFAE